MHCKFGHTKVKVNQIMNIIITFPLFTIICQSKYCILSKNTDICRTVALLWLGVESSEKQFQ